MKKQLLFPLLILSSSAFAENYQSISSFTFADNEFGRFENQSYHLTSKYYFAPKASLGPLDQFKYINTINNIFGHYSYTDVNHNYLDIKDNISSVSVGGEYFYDSIVIGGNYAYVDSDGDSTDTANLSLGYLLNKNLLLSANVTNFDNGSSNNRSHALSVKYNMPLKGSDYLGLSATAHLEHDYTDLTASYFTQLSNNRYIKSDATYTIIENQDDTWHLSSAYYFNKRTSLALSANKYDIYGISTKYFLDKHYAVSFGYSTSTRDRSDLDIFKIGLTVQL